MISFRLRYDCEDKDADFHASSFSSRTMVYKGMLTTEQLGEYSDLPRPDMESALADAFGFPQILFLVGQELNLSVICATMGKSTQFEVMRIIVAKQMQLASEVFGDDVEKLFPIIRADGSDSQNSITV